jgi:hypothetical protein
MQQLHNLLPDIQHAEFPIHYLSELRGRLNNRSLYRREDIWGHIPFEPLGNPILPYLKARLQEDGTLNITVDPENLNLGRMKDFQWLAGRPNNYREDYKYYRANYFNHLSVLRHRVSNEIWQRLAFDSEGLEQELHEVATHLLWLGITARSWVFHIWQRIAGITQVLEGRQMEDHGQWDGDWDLVVGELEKLAVLNSGDQGEFRKEGK